MAGFLSLRWAALAAGGLALTACATVQPRYPSQAGGGATGPQAGQGSYKVGKPYQVGGVWYVPREQPGYDETGVASWYGDEFHQKATANGELFDMHAVTAAHTTLPLPSMVEVTNLDNGRRLVVRVNDRGPFVGGRIIDLSREAARQLGSDRAGLARVRVRYLGPAPLQGTGAAGSRYAVATPAPQPPRAYDPVMEISGAAPARPAPVAAPPTVTSQALPPLTGGAIDATPIAPAPGSSAAAPATRAAQASSPLKVQVGAFASEASAARVVSLVAPAGRASVEPIQRDGLLLYRVMLPAPADEPAAYALRDRVADIGFTEARVVRTF